MAFVTVFDGTIRFLPIALSQNLCGSVWLCLPFGLADYFPTSFLLFFHLFGFFMTGKREVLFHISFVVGENRLSSCPLTQLLSFPLMMHYPLSQIELVSLIYLVYHAFCNWLTIILSTIVPIALIVYTVTENIMRTE